MQITSNTKSYFATRLLAWHHTTNSRSLPWKEEKNPYKIWVSEIILQQTRAQQGLPYYLAFTAAYPTVQAMATAADEAVYRLWQGLGYYNRCKNMLATARYISETLNGVFPASHDGLLALKGIGPYTAAAIASFAYGLPHAVVDGNVYRVLSRHFGIDTPTDTTAGKKIFAELAQDLLHPTESAAYNQAIMDIGATICTPRNPLCSECPIGATCVARNSMLISVLPVKSKKLTVKTRYFHYLLLHWQDTVWIEKRGAGDIWENLNQPYLIEANEQLSTHHIVADERIARMGITKDNINHAGDTRQRLTHQLIFARFFVAEPSEKPTSGLEAGSWLTAKELGKSAFPKTVVSFLEKNLYF